MKTHIFCIFFFVRLKAQSLTDWGTTSPFSYRSSMLQPLRLNVWKAVKYSNGFSTSLAVLRVVFRIFSFRAICV